MEWPWGDRKGKTSLRVVKKSRKRNPQFFVLPTDAAEIGHLGAREGKRAATAGPGVRECIFAG